MGITSAYMQVGIKITPRQNKLWFKQYKEATTKIREAILLMGLQMADLPEGVHMFLRQISTIKSSDRGKRGYFGNHKVINYYLQSTRSAKPPGQLSL